MLYKGKFMSLIGFKLCCGIFNNRGKDSNNSSSNNNSSNKDDSNCFNKFR